MPRPKNKIQKHQVKLRLEEKLLAELTEDAEHFGFDSVPALIEEILRLQYESWRHHRLHYEQQKIVQKSDTMPAKNCATP